MNMKTTLPIAALLIAACSGGGGSSPAASEPPAPTATPVRVARVEIRNLPDIVTAPGSTSATREERIRSPFSGTATAILVTDGDRVRRGQVVARVVARDSMAELNGAEEMLRRANTPAQRREADRAVALARNNVIENDLRASVSGIVTSHSAVSGDRVSEDEQLLTIAAIDSLAFVADVSQSQAAKIHPGDMASVELSGTGGGIAGKVESFLPGNSSNLTTPVRIRFLEGTRGVTIGLVGTADVVVAEHRNVPVVPEEAILRNDVNGTTRVAVVTADAKLQWKDVRTGLSYQGLVEIVSPPLAAGTEVITSGQVGLTEGTPVEVVH
ncbi:MAG: HlyD family efflux transporter periplasmic adaptor subunit [Thermoanaerobaculia bacterium]